MNNEKFDMPFYSQNYNEESEHPIWSSTTWHREKQKFSYHSIIKLTTAAAEKLAKIPNNLLDGLEKNYCKLLPTTIKKIQERGPLQYKLVQNAACRNPINLLIVDPEALQKIFDWVVSIMFKNKRISLVDGDKGKEQFDKLHTNDIAVNCSDFKNFDFKITRLDEFMKIYTMNGEKYPEMWKVSIFIFTHRHGQSSPERGFNVNKDSLKNNLDSSTLEALHFVLWWIDCTGE